MPAKPTATGYYPKAARCAGCSRREKDCRGLNFSAMPVYRRDGADVVVICNEYRQLNHNTSMKHQVGRGAGQHFSPKN